MLQCHETTPSKERRRRENSHMEKHSLASTYSILYSTLPTSSYLLGVLILCGLTIERSWLFRVRHPARLLVRALKVPTMHWGRSHAIQRVIWDQGQCLATQNPARTELPRNASRETTDRFRITGSSLYIRLLQLAQGVSQCNDQRR